MAAIKGTEKMSRYPNSDATMRAIKGITHYGTVKIDGKRAYKVAAYNVPQLESIGWRVAEYTSYYAYVFPPEVNVNA